MNTPGYQEALRRIANMQDGELNFTGLNLTVCPPIPEGVRKFNCYRNQLTALPDLPASLEILYCNNNRLTALPDLPPRLKVLFCYANQLTALPDLPASLQDLYCIINQLTALPELPPHLTILWCAHNQLTALPELPASLKNLDCRNNQLTALPDLPASLTRLVCDDNPFIEPFRGFIQTYEQTGDINQLRQSIHAYYASIRAKGRNVSALNQSFGQKTGPLPENMLSSIGSFLSGKPGTLNMQTTALKRNMGLQGGRRKTRRHRKSRKTRKEKSRRRH